ncbi:TPA: hypothetical protein ACQQYF_006758, partial [Pseudomonas aeruginosa]
AGEPTAEWVSVTECKQPSPALETYMPRVIAQVAMHLLALLVALLIQAETAFSTMLTQAQLQMTQLHARGLVLVHPQ